METTPPPISSLLWTPLSTLLPTLLTLLLLRFLFFRHISPLRIYPGPLLASGSRAWKVLSTYRGHTELDHIALHARYGPIVRIAPNEISFSSPAAARDIFTVGKGFTKTDFYAVFPPPENPDIFTETREWKHALLKRFAVTPYSLASMQKMTRSIEEVQGLLIEKLEGFAAEEGRGKVCDLGNWLHYFAFDVLGEVAFSRRFGFLAEGRDVGGQIKDIDDVQWYDGIVGQVPWVDVWLRQNPLKPYLAMVLPWVEMKPTPMTRIALDEVARREGEDKEGGNEDLLDQLLRAHRRTPEKFSANDVFAIAHGAIFAGSDSTASTMQSFFYHVLNDGDVLEKLTGEIRSAELSSTMVSYQEAQGMLFFQACLKETMRVRPAVGLNITRHVPKDGAVIDGTFFPGGTRVALNGWVLHLDEDTFGDDAEVYRPERWLTAGETKAREMERGMYQFGGGSHLCIGRNLALLEMNKILPQLLREFDFKLVHPGAPLKYHTTFFVVQEGLKIYVKRRKQ